MTEESEQRPVAAVELRSGIKLRAGRKVMLLVSGVAGRAPLDGGDGASPGADGAGSGGAAPAPGTPGGLKDGKYAIEATLLAPGGTPLAHETVRIHDPDTGAQVGDPGVTDENGVFRARVPEEKEYHLFTAAEEAAEHPDPFADQGHPQAGQLPHPDEHVVLFVELVDAGGKPVKGEAVTVKDAGGSPHAAQTDDQGRINLIVEHGVFTVEARGKAWTAHSLFTGDLGEEQQPYRFVLS